MSDKAELKELDYESENDTINDTDFAYNTDDDKEYLCSHGVLGCECEASDCETEDGFETY